MKTRLETANSLGCSLLSLLAALLAWAGSASASEATPFSFCRHHLDVGPDGVDAFMSCFDSAVAEINALYATGVENWRTAQQEYQAASRHGGDYYLMDANSCDAERQRRRDLERWIAVTNASIEDQRRVARILSQLGSDADALLMQASVGGYWDRVAPYISQMNLGATQDLELVERELRSATDFLADLQRTSVRNQCGHAEPIDPPSSDDPPSNPPAGGSSSRDLPNGHRRFENPELGGVRLNCDGGYRRVADLFCESLGYEEASQRMCMGGPSTFPTRSFFSAEVVPSGGSYFEYIVCRPGR